MGQNLSPEINGVNCLGFKDKMTIGFKPLCGLFSQFKHFPLQYMGSLTIELELVTNATDCIIDYRDDTANTDIGNRFTNDVDSVATPGAPFTNTSIDWEINNARVVCDVCTLDNNINNEYVKHLLEAKDYQLLTQRIGLNPKRWQIYALSVFKLFAQYLNW